MTHGEFVQHYTEGKEQVAEFVLGTGCNVKIDRLVHQKMIQLVTSL
jgi:hypothetical protein